MNEQFSKLMLNQEGKDEVESVDSGVLSSGMQNSGGSGVKIGGSGSSSSHYNNINANLHARVKAFQEQRALKRSSSVGSNKGDTDVAGRAKGSQNMQQIVNKPLPPLPAESDGEVEQSRVRATTAHRNVPVVPDLLKPHYDRKSGALPTAQQASNAPENLAQFNPSRKAPRRPPSARNVIPNVSSKPAQGLSARRGLQLPMGAMSLRLPGKVEKHSTSHATQEFAPVPSNSNHMVNSGAGGSGNRSNPGSLINGVQSTSTSSSNEEQRDTEGTAPRNSNSNSGGLFANFSKYVDIKSGSLNFAGKLSLSSEGIDFSNGYSSRITLEELEFQEELGHGNYGNVSKVLYKPTNVIMAMKEVRLELDEAKFRQILMELEVLHKCQSPYIVDFYGAFFIEGAVYMCMEYMDGGSLDKIYDTSPEIGGIDEPQLAYITHAVIEGLKELKDVHNIIHRDVKPTNILCSAKHGTVKLCDFGVSGNLVASLAKTNIGCQSYMAPERIRSLNPDRVTYTVQSDIWSLGLSILEMALGRYPYPPETFDNIFSQLSAIVDGPPPKLPRDKYSSEAQDFVSNCLQKIPERRPTYAALLEHPWLIKFKDVDVQMSTYITNRLEKRKELLAQRGEKDLPKHLPALHMGGL
ncbi:hypothetical protein HG537_0A08110 [Torulaspora globosa]|uniref:mitogen-activated protein kinase kinase n=1 Tax=Torulaspora globosa TaxID=48254 RepID=A0A7H9HL63_9SACH|nr:hypothetical protein HG537_0A08110 [Torulaspora sp. CBS 2947]